MLIIVVKWGFIDQIQLIQINLKFENNIKYTIIF